MKSIRFHQARWRGNAGKQFENETAIEVAVHVTLWRTQWQSRNQMATNWDGKTTTDPRETARMFLALPNFVCARDGYATTAATYIDEEVPDRVHRCMHPWEAQLHIRSYDAVDP